MSSRAEPCPGTRDQKARTAPGRSEDQEAIRRQLGAGHGILKVAMMVGCGSGTVQRVKREMAAKIAVAA